MKYGFDKQSIIQIKRVATEVELILNLESLIFQAFVFDGMISNLVKWYLGNENIKFDLSEAVCIAIY